MSNMCNKLVIRQVLYRVESGSINKSLNELLKYSLAL